MKNYALILEVTPETEINEQAAANLDPETPKAQSHQTQTPKKT